MPTAVEAAKALARTKSQAVAQYKLQASKLAQYTIDQEDDTTGSTQAVEAKFVTSQDPVIETVNGGRLPAVPLEEALKLNVFKNKAEGRTPGANLLAKNATRQGLDGTIHGIQPEQIIAEPSENENPEAPLREAMPPSRTNPLFPPLPMYGPPNLLRDLQCWFFRVTSAFLSLQFLLVIVLGSLFTSIPLAFKYMAILLTGGDPNARRPFYKEESRRARLRDEENKAWMEAKKKPHSNGRLSLDSDMQEKLKERSDGYIPTEGGPDPLVCDPRYYAKRVGLDCEIFDLQTEDGFIIELWHIYNPHEYTPASERQRQPHSPEVFPNGHAENGKANGASGHQYKDGDRPYPVLLVHGLLQSAGAYIVNDDASLAFYLAKSGYDVWLGNNRCGFRPRHNMLKYEDPRMWAWNIRQMGVMDLPAMISRVLSETGFDKLALIAHSQGTTQTLVALAKEQRPDVGQKISVFCALAPAAYAGPLIGKMYFKFMRVISPAMFRCIFGIHSFIPFMMVMHKILPGKFYGAMGYRVFSFLFNWSDERWDRGLRDRAFQFSPVYVSAESMRWWLGRECFARQKCILATREEGKLEDREDEEEEDYFESGRQHPTEKEAKDTGSSPEERGRYAWYDEQAPPMAFWVCGNDDLVDGRRLLRRFERGREPYVRVVHSKIIEGYEHLDVIWAIDSIEKVGSEVKEVIWRSMPADVRKQCRLPKGCKDIGDFDEQTEETGRSGQDGEAIDGRLLDTSAGEWKDEMEKDKEDQARASQRN